MLNFGNSVSPNKNAKQVFIFAHCFGNFSVLWSKSTVATNTNEVAFQAASPLILMFC